MFLQYVLHRRATSACWSGDVSQVSDHSDLLCVFAVAAVTCHCRISQCVVNLRAEDFPLCFRHTATLRVVHSDDLIHLVLFKMSN